MATNASPLRNTVAVLEPPRPWWRRLLGPLVGDGRAGGELSALRAGATTTTLPSFTGGWGGYTLDSSRVDYPLARALYRNTDDKYKLGAGFAKPIINTKAGFVGVPRFVYGDAGAPSAGDDARARRRSGSILVGRESDPQVDAIQEALDGFTERWGGKLLRLVRNAFRDGDAFARLSPDADRFALPGAAPEVRLQLIPPDWVTPLPDPTTGEWRALLIEWPVKYRDTSGREITYRLRETLTPTTRTVVPDERAPADALRVDEANPWGFIPVVHFKNEAEEDQLYGASDLEPVEPFLKVYHDVLLNAAEGSKLFARPKVKMTLKDVQKFLQNNFTPEQIRAGRLPFQGKDIYFMQEGEDAAFITADSGVVGITTLLQFIFFCIVDTSQVPEYVFGTAIASSRASAETQSEPFAKEIGRKRGQLEEPYGDLAAMFLAMWARGQNLSLAQPRARIEWAEVATKDEAATATAAHTAVQAAAAAVERGLVTRDTARDFLRPYFPGGIPEDEAEAVLAEKAADAERFRISQPPPAQGPPPPGVPDDEDEDAA